MSFRYVFEKYLKDPDKYPDVVLFSDRNAIIIRDQYPKSIFHFLVIPRSKKHTLLKPQMAFQDADFRHLMEGYVEKAKDMLVEEFNERYEVRDSTDSIENHIKVCCHSVPSLRNLHIHVMTTDLYSTCLKHKKHYNSFGSSFAINWDEMPLSKSDPRYDDEGYCKGLLKQDMVFEGVNYGGHFVELKKAIGRRFQRTYRERVGSVTGKDVKGKEV
ncbi:DEKNAAC102198 [Brettanomyces naardenensis]|uniref:DEKNAAC102198 n=1 Tax=Brettanomyces naardenensis TaxID=13370 RepID=A0A448YJW6_BRENA|nr:DEKNAAC102198 [Brettanomyces naardenensis]